jgi:asparagine synthetase A
MRLVCHLYDSNASAMSNVFRRSSTMSLIRQSMYAANMPNSTYVDQWDMEKFMEQVDRAKRKVPELRISADKYVLPDIFKRTKKASGDVKE